MLSGPKTWFGIPFLLAGLVFAVMGSWELIDANRIAIAGDRAQGTVIELQRSHGRRTSYKPIVGFETPDGETHTFVHPLGSRPSVYAAGDRVAVLYDPERPRRAVIDSFYGRYGFLIVVLGGAAFAALGAWLMRSDRLEQNELEG